MGIDPSQVLCDVAMRHNRRASAAGRVCIERAGVNETPAADDSFDKTLSVHTIYFWPDLHTGLHEIHRVLRPGGRLLLAFHSSKNQAVVDRLPKSVYSLRSDRGVVDALGRCRFSDVQIEKADGVVHGTIVWLCAPLGLDGNPLRDTNHPDEARHELPVVGIEMLSGFRADEDEAKRWAGGTVYDPGNGYTYRGTIRMEGDNRLLLRGFIGISLFGRTTTWIRVGSQGTHPKLP